MTIHKPAFDDAVLLGVLAQSNDATAVYDTEQLHIRFANKGMLQLWGKDNSVDGQLLEEVIPEIVGQPFIGWLQDAWRTGKTHAGTATPANLFIDGKLSTFYFDFEYRPILDNNGNTLCLLHTATDVTERLAASKLINEKEKRESALIEELRVTNKEFTLSTDQLLTSNQEIGRLNGRLLESDTNFKRLVEQSPVAILVLNGPELMINMANQPMLDILHREATIIGKPILEAMPELKGEPALELLFDVFRLGKESDGAEVPVRIMRDGVLETRYFNFSYRPLRDEGKIIGVMDIAVEVTDHVHSRQKLEAIIAEKTMLEKTLRASEQRLQGILDTMAEGVGIIDNSGQMVYANPMAQRILGLSEKDIKERTYHDRRWRNLRIDGSPLPDEDHPMSVMMRTGLAIYDQEISVQPPEGERFYISINAAPILDENGVITGGIGTFMDVTNRRKMMMQKDDFISVASHELKTPVTSLKASLQLLSRMSESGSSDMRAKLIKQSNRSLDKLSNLINDLLNSNRISQGQLQIHKTHFTVADMVSDCCNHIRTAGTHVVTLKGDVDIQLYADEQQLDQVMVNLVNNAVKYAPDSKEIIIEVTPLDNQIKIAVTDHGPGIPPEKLTNLFDRYYRADYSSVQFSGLGLGLYICAEIIRKHGGEIGVESEVGKGSTFWFTVPVE